MSIFSQIDKDINESAKVKLRQDIVKSFRTKNSVSTNDSPFYSPLLFDPNIVGKKNCENLIGQVSIPVGVAGPVSTILLANNQNIQLENLLIPLATTEGALVASINRGCKLLNLSGNTQVSIKNVGMTRAPVFRCHNKQEASDLIRWIKNNLLKLGKIGELTSSHLTYLSCQLFQKKDLVFARFAFDTGDAMGMNMVTIATSAISENIVLNNPNVFCLALSSNVCADKKTSSLNRRLGRGRWVTVTCNISNELITSVLRTTSSELLSTYQAKIVTGSAVAGLAGHNMQIANVAAAILTATGQDIAHTVDISQGTLTLRKSSTGIIANLSLPSVPVGTVGGGTSLETQTTARNLISNQTVTSDVLAATIGIAALAGELSGLASLTTCTLASSHMNLARINI